MQKRLNISGKVCGVLLCWGVVLGCGNDEQTAYEFFPQMMDTTSVKAQEAPMRMPVTGTIPRDFTPYPFAKDGGEEAGKALHNDLPRTRAIFQRGRVQFETYCAVCHGLRGNGDGTIVPKFPQPPSLHSEKVREWSDGRIYHVIASGQNLMPSYAKKVRPQDRWAIIRYIRALQRAAHPTAADVQRYLQQLDGAPAPSPDGEPGGRE